jgi:hypothetical protein
MSFVDGSRFTQRGIRFRVAPLPKLLANQFAKAVELADTCQSL